MPIYVYLGAAMVVGAVIVLVLSLHSARAPAQLVRSNLSSAPGGHTDLRSVVLERPTSERVRPTEHRLVGWGARRMTPTSMISTLEGRINLAGLSDRWPLERVLAAKLVLAAAGAFLGVVRFLSEPSGTAILLGAAAALIGFLVPDVLLSSKARERQEVIQRSLPDVLDQITICVEAGLGFEGGARPGRQLGVRTARPRAVTHTSGHQPGNAAAGCAGATAATY